jgi:23S rRNA (uracil1939-C5)-methyltransferase
MWDKILDINKCHLQEDPSNAIRNEVRDFANANGLTSFNPEHMRFCCVLNATYVFYGEIMVLIQFFENDKVNRELF